jgi:ParB family chromosome partitioning protein
MKGTRSAIDELPLESVFANPDQPRKEFDPEKLEELAMSIREYGVLEPIVVTPRGGRYMIIAGERRFRASRLAGRTSIPARVIEADDALVEELALLENVQREDLNIIEEARAYQALLDRGMTREVLAAKLGFRQPWRIDERTSLLKLTPEHQALVLKGVVGNSQAFEMSRLNPQSQEVLLRRIQRGELQNYNKLRAFVDGLLVMEKQEGMFELQSISAEEENSIRVFESLVSSTERALRSFHEGDRMSHLSKVVFHTGVSVHRMDEIIKGLQRVRKSMLVGAGIKEAAEEAVA